MEQPSTLVGGAVYLGNAHHPVLMNAEEWTSTLRVVHDAELRVGSVGCRGKDGGRPDLFKHIRLRVKRWLAVQRSLCHHVDAMELDELLL
jgi:hypothetical protein